MQTDSKCLTGSSKLLKPCEERLNLLSLTTKFATGGNRWTPRGERRPKKTPRRPTLLQHARQHAAQAALTYNRLRGTEREQTGDTSCNNRWHHVWVTATNQNIGMPALRWPHRIYEQREWNTSAKLLSEVVYPGSRMCFVRTLSGKFVSSVLIWQPLVRVYKYFSSLIFSSSVYPV